MPSPADDNYIPLGPVPCDEDHAESGMRDYARNAHKECRAYIQAIRRKLRPPPQGATFEVKAFDHQDFGTYYEVIVRYDRAYPASVAYALRCEREAPETCARSA